MLKKINILIICALAGFSSCADMDLAPNNSPSSQTYFISEAEIQHARVGLYQSHNSNSYFRADFFMWDGMTDQLYDQYQSSKENDIFRGSLNSSTGGMVSNFYSNAYGIIATANSLIQFVEASDNALFKNRTKAQYIADAQFFKAFYYFYLTELYGGVPLYKEALKDIESAKIAKSPKAEILTYILGELDEAIAVLDDGAFKGYVTKSTAKVLKGKILLYNERWSEAATAFEEVINSGFYELAPKYDELFYKRGQPNAELILFNESKYPEFAHSFGRALVHSASAVPRQEFVDSYLMKDGKTVSESPLDGSDYQNRDPRFYMTVRLPNDIWLDNLGAPVVFEPSLTGGYYIKKFLDPEINDNSSLHGGGTSEQGFVPIRYADVLLMYAEAKFRTNGLTQDIVDLTVNAIRERAGMPKVTNANSLTDAQKFDLIKYERSIELAFEGHHFFDLRRWGLYGETMLSLQDPLGLPVVWKDAFKLWPFSMSELQLNPNLEQNPGY